MSDEELRKLQRRWLASGTEAEEAALLGSQLRNGVLNESQVALAAYLGHPAALRVIKASPLGKPPEVFARAADWEPERWEVGELAFLRDWGRAASLRAALAVMSVARPCGVAGSCPAVRVAKALCSTRDAEYHDPPPQPEHVSGCSAGEDVCDTLREAIDPFDATQPRPTPDDDEYENPREWEEEFAFETAFRAKELAAIVSSDVGADVVRQAIQAAIVPWALRRGDPLSIDP